MGYSRAGASALILTKQTPDLLAGIRRCLWSLGALPKTLVWDRQAGIHGHGGRPSDEFAAFCGQLRVGWQFCQAADPQAKGVVERLQDFLERLLVNRAGRLRTSTYSSYSSTPGSTRAPTPATIARCGVAQSTA